MSPPFLSLPTLAHAMSNDEDDDYRDAVEHESTSDPRKRQRLMRKSALKKIKKSKDDESQQALRNL